MPDTITHYDKNIVNLCYNDSLVFTSRQQEWLGVIDYPEYYQKYCVTGFKETNAGNANKRAVRVTAANGVVRYFLDCSGPITLSVYTLAGERASVLFNGFRQAGAYTQSLGESLKGGGVYVVVLRSKRGVAVAKFVNCR